MAVKYLAGNRLTGTDAERLAMTVSTPSTTSQSSTNDYKGLPEGSWDNYGIKATSGYPQIGNTISSVTFYLAKYNSSQTMSGTLTAYVGSSGNYVTIGTLPATDVTNVPTTFDELVFTGTGTRVLAEDDYIWVNHGGGGTIAVPTLTSGAQTGTDGFWRGGEFPPTASNFSTQAIKQSVTSSDGGGTTYPNLPNGATFLTSDTNKLYMFDGTSAWNEVA